MPNLPENVRPVEEVSDIAIDQVVIGSCTNGGYQDIKLAANLLKVKTVASALDLIIVPGSRQVEQMLLQDNTFAELIASGARVIEPGCGPCIGMGFVPGSGSLSLRTVNRNWQGRGGNKEGKLALCSVEVATASAIAGCIADPRELKSVCFTPEEKEYVKDDTLFVFPQEAWAKEVRSSSNIIPLKTQSPPQEKLKGKQ